MCIVYIYIYTYIHMYIYIYIYIKFEAQQLKARVPDPGVAARLDPKGPSFVWFMF